MPKKTFNTDLTALIKKFKKNDVIAEIEKEYQRQAATTVPLSLIDDNSFIKRVPLKKEVVERMAKSLEEKGIYNPLVIRPRSHHYELILGRRRYFGAKKANLKTVPVIITEAEDEEVLLMLLADNRDMRDGNMIEMGYIYEALVTKFHYTQQMLGELSHQSRSQVTNTLRLLKLPDNVIREVAVGKLSYGHARALAPLSEDEINEMVSLIHKNHLSVRDTEILSKKSLDKTDFIGPKVEENPLLKTFGITNLIQEKERLLLTFKSEELQKSFLEQIKKLTDK